MTQAVYSLLMRLIVPLALARLWWRGRLEPGYREGLAERLGFHPGAAANAAASPVAWVHAVSVGEARASAGFVRGLLARGLRVVATCTTAAGRDTLRELHGDGVTIAWLPLDTPGAVRRFLRAFHPRVGVLVETEIWPNLVAACRERGVPVMLANARLSEKSAEGYRRWDPLLGPAVRSLSIVCAQTADHAARFASLGAARVEVTGNLKFDVEPDEARRAEGRQWRRRVGRPVLLLASTRDGEEKALLDALPAGEARVLVVLVPRHARRFDEVAALAQSRRSAGADPAPGDRVHLGDTMGEMDFYYGAADVAVIGGSFAPLGGQNLIEACAAGVPAIFGPSMFNFAEPARFAVDAGAALQVPDARAAIDAALRLLEDATALERMGAAGRAMTEAHRGATARQLACFDGLLAGSPAQEARAPAPG